MRIWITRTNHKTDDDNFIEIWRDRPFRISDVKSNICHYYRFGQFLKRMNIIDFKRLFNFLPEKDSCEKIMMDIKRIKINKKDINMSHFVC